MTVFNLSIRVKKKDPKLWRFWPPLVLAMGGGGNHKHVSLASGKIPLPTTEHQEGFGNFMI
jgi:hypothetical protein